MPLGLPSIIVEHVAFDAKRKFRYNKQRQVEEWLSHNMWFKSSHDLVWRFWFIQHISNQDTSEIDRISNCTKSIQILKSLHTSTCTYGGSSRFTAAIQPGS